MGKGPHSETKAVAPTTKSTKQTAKNRMTIAQFSDEAFDFARFWNRAFHTLGFPSSNEERVLRVTTSFPTTCSPLQALKAALKRAKHLACCAVVESSAMPKSIDLLSMYLASPCKPDHGFCFQGSKCFIHGTSCATPSKVDVFWASAIDVDNAASNIIACKAKVAILHVPDSCADFMTNLSSRVPAGWSVAMDQVHPMQFGLPLAVDALCGVVFAAHGATSANEILEHFQKLKSNVVSRAHVFLASPDSAAYRGYEESVKLQAAQQAAQNLGDDDGKYLTVRDQHILHWKKQGALPLAFHPPAERLFPMHYAAVLGEKRIGKVEAFALMSRYALAQADGRHCFVDAGSMSSLVHLDGSLPALKCSSLILHSERQSEGKFAHRLLSPTELLATKGYAVGTINLSLLGKRACSTACAEAVELPMAASALCAAICWIRKAASSSSG